MTNIPCIRHGHSSTRDARLVELLAAARQLTGEDLEQHLTSLVDYEGCLWATWREDRARAALSAAVNQAWQQVGGESGALHLIAVGDPYDYQEDIMNNVD